MTQAPPPPSSRCSAPAGTPAPFRACSRAGWPALLPEGADPRVTLHSGIDANGMSSETLVLDAAWTEDGQSREGRYVARVAPSDGGRAGVPELRPPGPVRRHPARRRPHRRPGARGRVHGADRRGARHAVLPHGPDRGDRPAGRACPTRSATTGSSTRLARSSRRCRTARWACSPGCTRSRTPQTTFAFLDPGRHLTGAAATGTPMERNLARSPRVVRVRGPRPRPLADGREDPRLAGGQPARRPRRHRAELGRRPDRQHDVPRLRAGRRPRLGDGDHRAAGARRVLDGLRPPGLRVDRDAVRAAGDAALPARGGRARDVRAAHRRASSAS